MRKIESGSLKRSTLEKALVKVGSYDSGEITLEQFIQLIDIIQSAVDANQLSYEYEEEEEGDKGKGFQTSKKSSVLGSSADDDDESDSHSDAEVSEEEAARLVSHPLLDTHSIPIPLYCTPVDPLASPTCHIYPILLMLLLSPHLSYLPHSANTKTISYPHMSISTLFCSCKNKLLIHL